MFFSFNKPEQSVHSVHNLQNPNNPENPMRLSVYRTHSRTALFSIYSKKAYAEFWDDVENKKIAPGLWTNDMKALAEQKITDAPKAPYTFKFTIGGWVFMVLILFVFGMIIYEDLKPAPAQPVEYVKMEQKPAVGDIYFGNYEKYKEIGNPAGVEIGYGWFKVAKVEGEDYYLAPSVQMNKGYKPKEQLNSSNFETETLPATRLTEQASYAIRFKSTDGLTQIYITDKK